MKHNIVATSKKCALVLMAFLLAACNLQESDIPKVLESDGLFEQCPGCWTVNGQDAGKASVKVYDSGFGFSSLPLKSIIRTMLDTDTLVLKDNGYLVPSHKSGIGYRAEYYELVPSKWVFDVVGEKRDMKVVMNFSDFIDGEPYSEAIYSKISGVYTITLLLTDVQVVDNLTDTVLFASRHDKRAKLVFVSTK